jgi:DNA-binding NarL/FixJ family response regulator
MSVAGSRQAALGPGQTADAERKPIRVMIVDDHKIFTELLEFSMTSQPDLDCVGKATTAGDALRMAAQTRPDVILMDIQLGVAEVDGLALTPRILRLLPQAHVLVFTALKDHHLALQAARAGAAGFLQKSGSLHTVVDAIRSVHNGVFIFDAEVVRALATAGAPPAAAPSRLTPREIDVLELVAAGMPVDVIAARLELSPHTCRTYIKNIERKLDARTRLEAVVKATRTGLLSGAASGLSRAPDPEAGRGQETPDGSH